MGVIKQAGELTGRVFGKNRKDTLAQYSRTHACTHAHRIATPHPQAAGEAEVAKLRQQLAMGMQASGAAGGGLFAAALTSVLEAAAAAVSGGAEGSLGGALGEDGRPQLVASAYGKAAPAVADVLALLYSSRCAGLPRGTQEA
jgi:hypothetical protein